MNCHVKEDGNVEEDVGEDQDDRRPSNFILNCRVSYEVGEEQELVSYYESRNLVYYLCDVHQYIVERHYSQHVS